MIRCEASTSNHMSIALKNDSSSSIANVPPVHETNGSLSVTPQHVISSAPYKPNAQSVIQSTSSTNGLGGSIPNSASISIPIPHNISRSHTSIHDPASTLSNQYFVLRSSNDTVASAAANPPTAYRERSIEETEAAHDLLSLSQSLPPLPAPCVVTILHPVTNYNGNSPDVQEITPNRSNEYITYTSGRTIQYATTNAAGAAAAAINDDHDDICTRNKRNASTQFDANMLPEDSSSSGKATNSFQFFYEKK